MGDIKMKIKEDINFNSLNREHIKFVRRLLKYFNIDYNSLTSYQIKNIYIAKREIRKIILKEYEYRKLKKELSNNRESKKRVKI